MLACSAITDLSGLTDGATSSASSSGSGASHVSASSSTSSSTSGGGAPSTTSASSTSSVSTSTAGSSGAGCSASFEAYDTSTGHCLWYDETQQPARYGDARSVCGSWAKGADLVAIETTEEAAFLFKSFDIIEDTWIGLDDQVTPGQYVWALSQDPLVDGGYQDWEPGSPNDLDGGDTAIGFDSQIRWANAPVSTTKLFICELP